MQKIIISIMISVSLIVPVKSKADLWGGDVAVLIQILAKSVQQLIQLKELLGTARGNLDLLKDVHRGINDSLDLVQTIGPIVDPGLYQDWQELKVALEQLEELYGIVVPSKDAQLQRDADKSVAEAIRLNNLIYKYSKSVDKIGETIKQYSHSVSPGGAQKLTAQSMGVMIHVLNQSMRAQATGLKLQAQTLALQNHKEKAETRYLVKVSKELQSGLKEKGPSFDIPRF